MRYFHLLVRRTMIMRGIALNPEEEVRLVADLGDANFVISRNHGLRLVPVQSRTLFFYMYIMQKRVRFK
jgi:hypothetical protein